MADLSASVIAQSFRKEYGRAVAVLTRVFGEIDLAEEAVQDAFAIALQRWPSSGVPPSVAGWIINTAKNKAIDHLRREAARADWHAEAFTRMTNDANDEPEEEGIVRDDQLRMIFTCCHPAMGPSAQVALTLRLIAGLTTEEIARAFWFPRRRWRSASCARKEKFATRGFRIACRSRMICRRAFARCSRSSI